MKIVKRTVVALVLCLALVGAYALLKKAPQLKVPSEDIHYLNEVGISASESASDEGLSGAHGSVQGAPPLMAPSGMQGSTTPPGSFGIPSTSAPPAPLSATNSESLVSESPVWAATTETIETEAPLFTTNSPTPPFVTANSGAVTASPLEAPC